MVALVCWEIAFFQSSYRSTSGYYRLGFKLLISTKFSSLCFNSELTVTTVKFTTILLTLMHISLSLNHFALFNGQLSTTISTKISLTFYIHTQFHSNTDKGKLFYRGPSWMMGEKISFQFLGYRPQQGFIITMDTL